VGHDERPYFDVVEFLEDAEPERSGRGQARHCQPPEFVLPLVQELQGRWHAVPNQWLMSQGPNAAALRNDGDAAVLNHS